MINCLFICLCICLSAWFIIWVFFYNLMKFSASNKYKYDDLIALATFFLEESYHIIYENDLFAYTSNGVKDIPKQEKETIERNFIKQTLHLMGPKNQQLLIDFFGSQDAFIVYMVRYIRKKFNNDTLMKLVRKDIEQ